MKRPDVILSIVGGLLVLAVSVTLGVNSIVGFFTPYNSSGPYTTPIYDEGPDGDFSPIATGDPGSPVALVPAVCPTACFSQDDFAIVGTGQAPYYALGLSPIGTAHIEQSMTTAAVEHSAFADLWEGSGNFADECFFTSALSPVVEPLDAVGVRADPVAHVGGGSASASASVEQWARVFPDSAAAVEYMATLEAGLESCHRYTDAGNYPTDVILRQAAIEVPDSVAALGWVRKLVSSNDRFYVMDLQRANLVIRTVGYNDGTYTDAEMREFMEKAADELGSLSLP